MNLSDEQLPPLTDDLLKDGLVRVPPGFAESVVLALSREAISAAPSEVRPLTIEPPSRWQWLGIALGTALGLGPLLSFVFGIWISATAY